ncbi:unnamed protein product [Microthlaspi erraticum]|uniref:Uncharacterized protein n=1 Tax=Microthlaspi erraticum TaxID=1685480 RepID=A0A6D2I6X6_9BRAS|nr:unnamed protein product [Microthlaspi erraticum]
MQSPLETQQPERCCRPTTSIVIAEHGLCDKTASGKRTGSSGKTKKTRGGKEDTDSDEADFWMLKSSSGSESEHEGDEENCKGSHCDAKVSDELSERTKRMSIEIRTK